MRLARTRVRSAAALTLLLCAAACGGGGDEETPASADSSERLSIKFGTPSDTLSSSFYAFVAAQELGYWEDENLDVELVPGSGSGALVEQMVAGNLDAGAPSLPAVVEGLGAGLKIVNPYTISYGSIFSIWVPADSDIQSVEELKGKTIGNAEAGGGEVAVLNAALEEAGIDPVTEVKLIPIGAGEATTLDAIESGRVDAYSSSRNDGFSLEVSGVELRDITPEEYKNYPGRAIVTTPEGLEAKREEITRLARGVAKATVFCDANREACQGFLQEALPEQWVGAEEGKPSQGSLQYEEAIRTSTVPEDEQVGRHYADEFESFKETVGSTAEGFNDFAVSDFITEDLLDDINDFDRAAIVKDAEAFE